MNNNRYIIDCDFHTHTGFSDDCDVSVEEMLKSAADQGIRTLAVTDHYDPGYPDPEFPFTIDFKKYQGNNVKSTRRIQRNHGYNDRPRSRYNGRTI